jgi:hypothetical protein
MGGAETTAALRAMGFSGLILGMTGDPSGCEERSAFEASGLDACLDKDSTGMSECVKLIKLHAARLLVDAEALAASRESGAAAPWSVSSGGRSRFYSVGERSSNGSTATQDSARMPSRFLRTGSNAIRGLFSSSPPARRRSPPARQSAKVAPSTSPLAMRSRLELPVPEAGEDLSDAVSESLSAHSLVYE